IGDYRRWNARQPGHLYAVALVRRPLLDSVEKHDVILVLGGVQMNVCSTGYLLWQGCQFKIVGGEETEGTYLAGQVAGAGPGEGEAVKGAGATTNFIHEHQAGRRRIVQYIGGFGHLYHKG